MQALPLNDVVRILFNRIEFFLRDYVTYVNKELDTGIKLEFHNNMTIEEILDEIQRVEGLIYENMKNVPANAGLDHEYHQLRINYDNYCSTLNKIKTLLPVSNIIVIDKDNKAIKINKDDPNYFKVLKSTYNGKYKDFVKKIALIDDELIDIEVNIIGLYKGVWYLDKFEKISGKYKLKINLRKNIDIYIYNLNDEFVCVIGNEPVLNKIIKKEDRIELVKQIKKINIEMKKAITINKIVLEELEINKMLSKV